MSKSKSKKHPAFYAIHDRTASGHGRVIDGDWSAAQELIAGIRRATGVGPSYKKFHYESDATYFVKHGCEPTTTATVTTTTTTIHNSNNSIKISAANAINVFTDGSSRQCRETQQRQAGIGVFFGPHHALNAAEPLLCEPPLTNNRAELTAIRRALEIIASPLNVHHLPSIEQAPHVIIYTDSTYSRDALGKWRTVWEATNFKQNTILNRDIIVPLWQDIDTFFGRSGRTLEIVWVKGHANIAGNSAADSLAEMGARLSE